MAQVAPCASHHLHLLQVTHRQRRAKSVSFFWEFHRRRYRSSSNHYRRTGESRYPGGPTRGYIVSLYLDQMFRLQQVNSRLGLPKELAKWWRWNFNQKFYVQTFWTTKLSQRCRILPFWRRLWSDRETFFPLFEVKTNILSGQTICTLV